MKTKSFRLLTVLLAAVMLVALSLNVFAASSNAVTKDGLTAQLFTDKDSYKSGESVNATVRVDNHAGRKVFIFTSVNVPANVTLANESAAYDGTLEDGDTWITPGGSVTTGAASAAGSAAATGDNMRAGLWVIFTVLAVCGIIALFVYGKNKKTWISVLLCMAMVGGLVVAAVPARAADASGDIQLRCIIQVDGKDAEVAATVSYVIYDDAEEAEVSTETATPTATEEPTATPAATEEPTATPAATEEPTATPTVAPTEEPNLYDPTAGMTEFSTNTITSSTANAEAVLWSEFVPKHEDGTVYSGVIGRLGHQVDGTPYLLFAQQYNKDSSATPPSVTRWLSKNASPEHWLELTFSEEKQINSVGMFFHYATYEDFPMEDYTISYLKDGNWVQIVEVDDNRDRVNLHRFEPVTTTKIRVDITDPCIQITTATGEVLNDGDNYARLNEIEVYDVAGNNIARNAQIEADSVGKANGAATMAIDGWRDTIANGNSWRPVADKLDENNPHWLMVDFGEAKDINEIHVDSADYDGTGYSRFTDYELQYNSGTPAEPVWETIKSETGNKQFNVSARFETVKTQQIRFCVTKTNEENTEVPRISSFTVYNRPSDVNLAENAIVKASSEDFIDGCTYKGEVAIKNLDSASISCLTAVTLDGKILWQKGKPATSNYNVGKDLPIQIYDIDYDGAEEIIVVYNDCIQVFSPEGELEGWSYLDELNADSIIICDIRGTGSMQDIIIKDRYWKLVALKYVGDGQFEKMWDFCELTKDEDQMVGHYPYAYDFDGDGKDEIMTGNRFLDDDGSVIDSYIQDKELTEHADAIKVGDFDPAQDGVEIVLAHSLNGNIFINQNGERYSHDAIGHSQKMAVGNFCPTVPGLEIFTSIKETAEIYLQKGNGERIWPGAISYSNAKGGTVQIDPSSFIMAGSGQEYLLAHRTKLVIDGYNNKIVQLPDDAPRFGWSVNVCGDEREELVMWNDQKVQIWTNTAVVPDGGKNLCLDESTTIITDSTADGYSVDALKDADRTQGMWMSKDTPDDHYILVDFGAEKTFDELWLYHYENNEETYYLDNFKIQYNKGTVEVPEWIDIHDVKANMKKQAAYTFEPVTAQQVRILITDPTTAVANVDSAARVCEIEIYEALADLFTPVVGEEKVEDNTKIIDFGVTTTIDGVSLAFTGAVRDYTLQCNIGTKETPEWIDLVSKVSNNISVNNYAFTPISANALRVVVTEGEGTVQNISVREWNGYDYQNVVNELIENPTKSGNTGSYRWTQY